MNLEKKFEKPEQTDKYHTDTVPELSFWWQTRAIERSEYGENIIFGPGYGQCVEHYYESELGQDVPNNKLLDLVAEKMALPRDRIVPVMAGSLSNSEYLENVIIPEKIIPLSTDLDIIICQSPEDAKKLRDYSPILLPLPATKKIIYGFENNLKTKQRDDNYLEAGKDRMEKMRIEIAKRLNLPAENLSLHLGSDEIIKATFRGIASKKGDNENKPTVFIPLPNYFDAINFAKKFNFNIIPDMGANELKDSDKILKLWFDTIKRTKPDAVYLSNPNNPLGYTLNLKNLKLLLRATPPGTRFIIDEVNLDLENSKQLLSLPWKELKKEFPHHHIILVDSFSKSHDMASERVGFGLATQREDSVMLRDFEPPLFTDNTYFRTGGALFGEPIENQTRKKMQYFYERLLQIQEKSNGQISVGPTLSNFCVVEFRDLQTKTNFYEKLKNSDPGNIQAKRIIGMPLEGSGQLKQGDLNNEGVLKNETFERKGIMGLPANAVRFSALNHPFILDALEEVL